MSTQHDRQETLDFAECFTNEPPEGSVAEDLAQAKALRRRRRQTVGAAIGGLTALALSALLVGTLHGTGSIGLPADQPRPTARAVDGGGDDADRRAREREQQEREGAEREKSQRAREQEVKERAREQEAKEDAERRAREKEVQAQRRSQEPNQDEAELRQREQEARERDAREQARRQGEK